MADPLPVIAPSAAPVATGQSAWIGFMAAAFLAVGLTGLFATFAAPLPLERAIARESALDDTAATARSADPAALAILRDRLDDSADAVLGKPGSAVAPGLDARVASERVTMRARLLADARATATRLRWLITIVTIMSAVFGAAAMQAGRRRP